MIHFDIDAAEVGKIRKADIPVVGPLKLALDELTDQVRALAPDGARPPARRGSRQLAEWRDAVPVPLHEEPPTS